jgi:hypothetical protein
MYREREEVHTGLWWRNPRERDYLENPGAGGWITLKTSSEVGWGGHGLD